MRRIPILIIHPIEDTVKILLPLSQNSLQPITVFRGLDLFAIFLADRIDRIRVDDPCLHEIDPFPKFDSLWIIHFVREAGQREFLFLKYSLISNVMDREHHSRTGEERIVLVDRSKIGWNQTGLPFMVGNDRRGKCHELAEDENRLGEEDETFCIVEIVPLRCTVEVFPIKELITTDEIDRDPHVQLALINIRLEDLISNGDLDLL